MRLIENQNLRGCSSDTTVVLARHGVDVPILSKDLNQPLIEETKPDIKLLGSQMVCRCRVANVRQVKIWHSNRLRAIQTAAIVCEQFFNANMSAEMCETIGVREIYQGNFRIENHIDGMEYKPLVDAWSAWQKKLDACELLYRFGDPLFYEDDTAEFPELTGWFTEFGENQGEFSLRLYTLLERVLMETDNRLQIIIGHQASCSRIQRIFSAMNDLKTVEEFNAGEFVRYLEKKGSRVTIEPACGIIVWKPCRDLALAVLRKEIRYLKSITGAL